jgi:hypothetical protein
VKLGGEKHSLKTRTFEGGLVKRGYPALTSTRKNEMIDPQTSVHRPERQNTVLSDLQDPEPYPSSIVFGKICAIGVTLPPIVHIATGTTSGLLQQQLLL